MMQVFRISKCKYIHDLNGTGAAKYPGRWHSKGTYILYTASTPALALLESVVHIAGIPLEDYCLIGLEIPDNHIFTLSPKDLPENWFTNPPPGVLSSIGDRFIQRGEYFGLQLPSAIMPEDSNILLNPNHKDFQKVKIMYTRKVPIDERLL